MPTLFKLDIQSEDKPPREREMDDNNESFGGQTEPDTQIVDFANAAEDLLTNPLKVQEISGTSIKEGLPFTSVDTQHVVSSDLQDQHIERHPTDTSEAAETSGTSEEGALSPFQTHGATPIWLQEKGAQPSPNETHEASQIPKSRAEMSDSNDGDLPDEVPASREKHAPEISSPLDPEIQQGKEKEKVLASPVEPPLLAPDSNVMEGASSEISVTLAAAASLKKTTKSLPAGQSARGKTVTPKRDTQKMSKKKDGQPETAQKAPDQRDTGKAPASVSTTKYSSSG